MVTNLKRFTKVINVSGNRIEIIHITTTSR